ncbi:unnamed protein product [Coregonus sp. 'balchen']|nr:unnamed protein product [Coregonus sp. 'balchen']
MRREVADIREELQKHQRQQSHAGTLRREEDNERPPVVPTPLHPKYITPDTTAHNSSTQAEHPIGHFSGRNCYALACQSESYGAQQQQVPCNRNNAEWPRGCALLDNVYLVNHHDIHTQLMYELVHLNKQGVKVFARKLKEPALGQSKNQHISSKITTTSPHPERQAPPYTTGPHPERSALPCTNRPHPERPAPPYIRPHPRGQLHPTPPGPIQKGQLHPAPSGTFQRGQVDLGPSR